MQNVQNQTSIKHFWRDWNFSYLWLAQTFSEFGSKISLLALPLIAVMTLHVSPFQMGLLAACETLPFFIFSLVVGALVDRLPKQCIMVFVDLARAIIILGIPILSVYNLLNIKLLFLSAFLIGMLEVWFSIALGSFIPLLIPKDQLVQANSKLSIGSSIAESLGSTIAGLLVQLIGASYAIIGNSLTYIISGFCIGKIKGSEQKSQQLIKINTVYIEMIEGIKFVFKNRIIRATTLRLAAWHLVVGTVEALFIFYAIKIQQLSAAKIGMLFAAIGIGVFVGSILANWLSSRVGIGKSIMTTTFVAALAGIIIPLAHGNKLAVILMLGFTLFIYGVCAIIYQINNISLRQMLTPHAMLGRMNATVRFVTLGVRPLGAIMGGIVANVIGVQLTITIAICLGIVLNLIGLFISPLSDLTHLRPSKILLNC